MGWLTEVLAACCTAWSVAESNVVLGVQDPRLSNSHLKNEKQPILPRHGFRFHNATIPSATLEITSWTPTTPTILPFTAATSLATPQTKSDALVSMNRHSPSNFHHSESISLTSAFKSETSLSGSGNAPFASHFMSNSGTASDSITTAEKLSTATSTSSVTTTAGLLSTLISLTLSEEVSSGRASSTVQETPYASGTKFSASISITQAFSNHADLSCLPNIHSSSTTYNTNIVAWSTVANIPSSSVSLNGPLEDTRSVIPVSTIYSTETQPTILAVSNLGTLSSEALMSWNPHAPPNDAHMETSSVFPSPMATSTVASLRSVIDLDWPISTALPSYTLKSPSKVESVGLASPVFTTGLAEYDASSFVKMPSPLATSTSTPVAGLLSHSALVLACYLSSICSTAAVIDSSEVSSPIKSTLTVDSVMPTGIISSKQQANVEDSGNLSSGPYALLNSTTTVNWSSTVTLESHTESNSLASAPFGTILSSTTTLRLSTQTPSGFAIDQNMSSPTIIQHPSKSDESSQLGPVFTLLPTNGSYAPMITSAISPPFPKTSISSKTGIGSFTTRTSNGTHPIASSTLRTSVTGSPTLQTLTSLSTFQTRTRTQSSSLSTPTGPILNNVTVVITTIVPVAATPPLSPSQTAGVALGSTAGVLLAIVAALFLVRRYHAMHAAKRASEYNPVMITKRGTGSTPNRRAGLISFAAKGKSRESSKAYPEEAYLYDPSLGANSGRNSADVEASMSHGADGLLARRIGPLPPAPHTSFEDGHGPSIPNVQHNDLGSSLKSPEDPYLNWRSSTAIGTSKDQASALVAAITDYGAGPQKPLPPIPITPSTYSSNNNVSPSPKLSPLVNNDSGSRHSYTRSSSRSSVSSQRSLRPLRIATSPNPASNDYPPLSPYERVSRQSLGTIIETSTHEPCMNSRESDLPLRFLGTETSDSVAVYAPIPAAQKQPRKRPALTTVFSQDSCTVAPLSIAKCAKKSQTTPAKLRSRGSILFPASNDSPYYSSLIQDLPSSPAHRQQQQQPSSDQPTTNPPVYYSLFPKPPSYLKPQHKGWEDIKHNSNRSSIAASLPPPQPQLCAPPPHTTPSSSPPAPLKERSFLPLRRKTPLMDGYSQSSLSSQNPYAKFTCKTGFEGPRMSLFAKVNSMREEDQGGLREKMGDGDGKL